MHIVQYRRGQRALQRTPPSIPEARADTALVRKIVHGALQERRELLTEPEAQQVLAAYGIPVVRTEVARDAADAASMAGADRLSRRAQGPVARDHAQVGCGRRRLSISARSRPCSMRPATDQPVCTAAPGAALDGFVVQPMVKRPGAIELILGASRGSGVRADRDGGSRRRRRRGDRRQGAGAAAARRGAGRGGARPHAGRSPAARLSRPAAGRARRGGRGDDPPVAAHRRRRRDRRTRHQSAAGRCRGRDRARCAHRRAHAGRQKESVRRASRSGPIRSSSRLRSSTTARNCASGRSGRRTRAC